MLPAFNCIVIRPDPVQQVNPDPGDSGSRSGLFHSKTRPTIGSEKTVLLAGSTRNSNDLAKPDRDLVFFFKCVFFLVRDPSFFILFNWLLTHIKVHYINTRRMFYFFNMRFETHYYIYFMFTRKKIVFFQCEIKNLLK